MRISRRAAGAAAGVTLALAATTAVAAPAANAIPASASTGSTAFHTSTPSGASKHCLGTKSLVSVLAADKSGFDTNGKDFDILTAAVTAVLKAKPKSPVGVLANGKVALTAFIPNDQVFRLLVKDLTGKAPKTEAAAFTAVAGLGIPMVEKVLLYHVVPGVTITSTMALKSNNAVLKTAAGLTIKVRVTRQGLFIQDKDPNSRNPKVVAVDVNKGNRQIAHVIDRVLRPLDLPPVAKHH